jgi:hypothetical protein
LECQATNVFSFSHLLRFSRLRRTTTVTLDAGSQFVVATNRGIPFRFTDCRSENSFAIFLFHKRFNSLLMSPDLLKHFLVEGKMAARFLKERGQFARSPIAG